MRRYRIVITPSDTTSTNNVNGTSVSAGRSLIYDSQINGQDNPSALDIAFDVVVAGMDLALPGSYIQVFGVPITEVSKVRRWQGAKISLWGGFSSGFPLADASQYGLLAKGTILQAYGNWSGLDQSVVFVLTAAGTDREVNFYWEKGKTLSSAVSSALYQYTGYKFKSMLTNDAVATQTVAHYSDSIYTFGQYLKEYTNSIGLASGLNGVLLVCNGDSITLYDSPVSSNVTTINFNDFQGQPLYFGYGGPTVQTALNLRHDLSIGSKFKFPNEVSTGYLMNTPSSMATLPKDNSIISGTFIANSIRHIGKFRDPHADSWVTVVDGVPA